MKRKVTGLRTTLYTYTMGERAKFEKDWERLEQKGTITQVFIANGYAFELRKFRIVYK